ncbi:hypothetical protein [Streptomyces sp. NPDC008139]|uniref:hypothetical protein n=1 Tax=Streptomyces sp. NPDC008139 TaxID=3364814 RepID=UPI0036E835B8
MVSVVATSAVWAAVLAGIGQGRDHSPDLHGYRVLGNTCTTANLEPFTEALALQRYDVDPGSVLRGPTLDHASCVLSGTTSAGDGWTTRYAATVTVDLHKKTDPRPEFEDAGRVQSPGNVVAGPGTYASPTVSGVARPVTGLGDLAFSVLSDTRQTVRVLDGDAVLSLTIDGTRQWQGSGTPPATDGALVRPVEANTTFLRPILVPTMRQLMTALTSNSAS